MTELTLTLVLLAIAAVYLASHWVQHASTTKRSPNSTFSSRRSPISRRNRRRGMEKPASMPWAIWSEVEDHRREWKREEERVESAKLHQTVAKQNLEKAKKQTFGRKAAVAQYQADLDALIEKEKARLEAPQGGTDSGGRKGARGMEGATLSALEPEANGVDRTWRINGGVAPSRRSRLRQWNVFTQGEAFQREEKEIRVK